MAHPDTGDDVASAQQRWRAIVDGPGHTPQTWAWIAAAVRHADHAARQTHAFTGQTFPRGGPQWSAQAVASYQIMRDVDTFAHRSPGERPCAVDEFAARTWLTAPSLGPADTTTTTTAAETLQIDEEFLTDDEERPARLARLIEAAQDAGVLRADGIRLELWHHANDDGDLDGHRLGVLLHHTVTLASGPLSTDDLADDTLTGIDAAVDVLTTTARIASEVLTNARPVTAPGRSNALARQPTTARGTPTAAPPPLPAEVAGFWMGEAAKAFPPPTHAGSPPGPPEPPPPGRAPHGPIR